MWIRRRKESEFEAALRGFRAEAPPDLVENIAGRVLAHATPTPPRRAWSRLAFAAAVSTFVLGSFASFGGLSYAAPGVNGTVSAVKQVVRVHTLKVKVKTPSAASQYPPEPSKPKTSKPKTQSLAPPKPKPSQTEAAGATKTPAAVASGGTLPFTGMSLLGTLVVSLALIALGLALRRRERRS